MAPYDGYQEFGPGSQPVYGRQMSQGGQDQMDFAMQQNQARVVIPTTPLSAPHPRQASQPQAWNQPHPNFQHQQLPPHTPQYQNYYQPQPSQGQQYAQPSPLHQFAAGNFAQAPQQYWQPSPQGVQYQVPYTQAQQPQQYPPQSQPLPPQQQARRQPSMSSLGPREAPTASPMPRPRDVNQHRPQQHSSSQQRTSSQPSQPRPHPTQPKESTPSQGPQKPRQSSSTHGSHRSTGQAQRTPQSAGFPSASDTSTPSQRTLAHVQIPVQQAIDMAPAPQYPRSPKRRCSNERKPVHIKQEAMPPPIRSSLAKGDLPPESSPLTELNSSQIPPTPSGDVDYQELLLSLSDEYVSAAHSMSGHLCSDEATEEDHEQYNKLLATAMACLQSVLAHYRFPNPSKEARIRLRLATLLYEETENSDAAQETLTKGIALCQREKLVDTRYAMEHLLVRIVYKSSPKAAFKAVEKIIAEAEAYRHHMWVFALRFLRVSLSVESDGPLDASSVLKHLAAISSLADALQQTAVQVAAATLEAMVHLRVGGPEAVELAQRSLAAARTHQFEPGMEQMPQLRAALDCLDLSCNFVQPTIEQTQEKMARMHHNMDATTKGSGWPKDGTFVLPMSFRSTQHIEADSAGIFRITPNGTLGLSFKWLSRSQLYMIGFILSGYTLLSNNSDHKKAETFLSEGLKLDKPLPVDMQLSLPEHEEMRAIHRRAALTTELTLIFALCGRADWVGASHSISSLSAKVAESSAGHDEFTTSTLLYLGGVCKQGLGELPEALELYSSPKLAFDPQAKHSPPLKDIQCLAALNSVFILCAMPPPHPENAQKMLNRLDNYCLTHVNKLFHSAFYLLRAHACPPDTPIIKTKQHLQNSLTPAQAVKNSQLLNIIMNTMTELFFKDINGKQALGSANAGRSLARKTQDPLWCAVAEGMYRDLRERSGDLGAANAADSQIRKIATKVPAGVKRGIGFGA